MKQKKQMFLAVLLFTCFTLAGCMNPAIPKDAYIKGMNKMEAATTYQKTSTVHVETETTGAWEENQTVLLELLNKSTLEVRTLKDQTKGQSETTLRLSGGFDYVPVDTTLQLFFDEKRQKTYIQGEGLVATFAPYAPLPPAVNTTWIEVGSSKEKNTDASRLQQLLEMDTALIWPNIPMEKFSRSEVSLADKKAGIRDVVTLSLEQTDLQQILPSLGEHANKLTVERITFTRFLDRKSNVVKEKIETKFTHKNNNKTAIVHASVVSTYDSFNETIPLRDAPKAHEIRSFDALFAPEAKTETKKEKP